MMRHIMPMLISVVMYVGFRHYCCRERVDKKLWMEALYFSLLVSVVMYMYQNTYGYEYFDNNHGEMCPPGHIKVDDPVNAKQKICRPDPRGKDLLKSPPEK